MKGIPEDVSDEEADKAKSDIEPVLEQLKAALAEVTKALEQDQEESKEDEKRWLAARACNDKCLAGKSNAIVAQVAGTLKGVVTGLGAGKSSKEVSQKHPSRQPHPNPNIYGID